MQAIIEFLKELIARLKMESPKMFITIRWVSFALMLISGAAYFGSQMEAFTIGATWYTISEKVLYVLAGVWGLSFLPVKESEKLQKTEQK
ncbi:MAG: hypothetical protein GX465_14445 [Acidobacteria bacterium]|nr:hypothetical protein [Acidobacteriota bacterium]